jgi:UDP-glucose 4-epimerase
MVEVKHFIFTSTANVYSPSDQLLEEDSPTVPESFYGATKLAAENFARQYQPYFQVDILRLFTIFGPGQRSMLIPTMIERIKNGKEIILAENVGISLTPIYIADLLNVINQFIQLSAIDRSRTVNVCGSSVVSLKKIVGIPAKTRITESKATSMKGSCAALERIIGSFCITDLNNGLQSTISNRTEESV